MIKRTFSIITIMMGMLLLNSCQGTTRGADALSNAELETLVSGPIRKMINSPRAKKHLQSGKTLKIELLDVNNKTNYSMDKEAAIIHGVLEELFINYENVEFYSMADRLAGNDSINQQNSAGLIRATDQKQAGEQIGADDNIQVTITSTTAKADEEEFRLMLKWYDRESQRPIGKTSIYITKPRF